MRRLDIPNNEILHFYKKGTTIKKIAMQFGCAPSTVRRRLAYMDASIKRGEWQFTKKFFPRTIRIPDSPVKLAYLAGIVDGEGTIDFIKNKTRRRKEVAPRMKVGNTDLDLIRWLLAEIGGRVYVYKPKNKTHKMFFEWFISGVQNIQPLLLAIFPYLVIKRKNAEKVLEFCKIEVEKRAKNQNTVVKREFMPMEESGTASPPPLDTSSSGETTS